MDWNTVFHFRKRRLFRLALFDPAKNRAIPTAIWLTLTGPTGRDRV
jgi:hypothetical protein